MMAGNNEPDWEEYEAITKYIYEALGSRHGVTIKGYGRNCTVKGRSGLQHQVDVLTEQADGDGRVLTAIECKYAKKKVTKEVVMKLAKVMEDADIANGIIVCKAGFTKDTLIFAEHEGIKLVRLWEAGENDEDFNRTVEIGTADLNFKVMLSRPLLIRIDFGAKTIGDEDQIRQMYGVRLQDAEGNHISFGQFIAAFSEEMQKREDPSITATIKFPLNRLLFCNFPEGKIAAKEIAITGALTNSDQSFKRSLVLTDQVWMVMNELFDKRKLTLSKSGLIWHLPTDK